MGSVAFQYYWVSFSFQSVQIVYNFTNYHLFKMVLCTENDLACTPLITWYYVGFIFANNRCLCF